MNSWNMEWMSKKHADDGNIDVYLFGIFFQFPCFSDRNIVYLLLFLFRSNYS